eukprot:m.29156 g.29156  ORF g.29156 m.29156 type:complete len:204 (-) comp9131_c0_seq1:326-937(-)
MAMKSFVSTDELKKIKEKRQAEWEKNRKEGDPEECPEEVYDHRSLYERLQAAKNQKQEEFEKDLKDKTQIFREADEDDMEFLELMVEKQIREEDERWEEEGKAIREYKQQQAAQTVSISDKPKQPSRLAAKRPATKKSSQAALLAKIIKQAPSQGSGGKDTEPPPKAVEKQPQSLTTTSDASDDSDDDNVGGGLVGYSSSDSE